MWYFVLDSLECVYDTYTIIYTRYRKEDLVTIYTTFVCMVSCPTVTPVKYLLVLVCKSDDARLGIESSATAGC